MKQELIGSGMLNGIVGLDLRDEFEPSKDLTLAGKLTITIDGPAGTGKSTMARLLASRLGLEFLDTGAMYRAAALIGMKAGISLDDGPALSAAVQRAELRFDWGCERPRLWVHWPTVMDVTDDLRGPDITSGASRVAGLPEVRKVMVETQRAIRDVHPRLVTEGRDQGSVVFPDAQVKFYLDATPEVRAIRRADQLRRSGHHADADEIIRDIMDRDRADMSRTEGPLIKPAKAIVVDTTEMTPDQVVDRLEREVRCRIGADLPGV